MRMPPNFSLFFRHRDDLTHLKVSPNHLEVFSPVKVTTIPQISVCSVLIFHKVKIPEKQEDISLCNTDILQVSSRGISLPKRGVEMSRNVQSGNTQNLKSMVIQRSFPKWSVAERRKTAAASNQAACCACTHSRYLAGGSPSGLRV